MTDAKPDKDKPDARYKLTLDQIEEIRKSPYRPILLAKIYGVSIARVSQIQNEGK